MKFNPMAFIDNLQYMAIGMLSIFIVIGVIMLMVELLHYFTKKPEQKQQ